MIQWIVPSGELHPSEGYSFSRTSGYSYESESGYSDLKNDTNTTSRTTLDGTAKAGVSGTYINQSSSSFYSDSTLYSTESMARYSRSTLITQSNSNLFTASGQPFLSDDYTARRSGSTSRTWCEEGSTRQVLKVESDSLGGVTTFATTESSFSSGSTVDGIWTETITRRNLASSTRTYSVTDGFATMVDTNSTHTTTSSTSSLVGTYSINVCTAQTTGITNSEVLLTSWGTQTQQDSILTWIDGDGLLTSTSVNRVHVSTTSATLDGGGLDEEMSDGGGTTTVDHVYLTTTTLITVMEGETYVCHGLELLDTYVQPDPCNQLYTAGPMGAGVSGFSSVWQEVPSYLLQGMQMVRSEVSWGDHGGDNLHDDEDGLSTYGGSIVTRSLSTSSSFSVDSTIAAEGLNWFGVAQEEISEMDAPLLMNAVSHNGWNQVVPCFSSGYVDANNMGNGVDLCQSYTIAVAGTVSDALELAQRLVGATYNYLGVTQVHILHSDDSLFMGAGTNPATAVGAGGGFGQAEGNVSITLYPGIYQGTRQQSDGGTNTFRLSVADTTSSTTEQAGVMVSMDALCAYTSGGGWPLGDRKILLAEFPCSGRFSPNP